MTPEKVAVISDGTPLTYGELAAQIEALCRFLRQAEVPAGVTVIWAPTLLESWKLGLALRRLGHTTLCVRDAGELADGSHGITSLVGFEPFPQGFAGRTIAIPALPTAPGNEPRAAVAGNHILLTSGTTGTSKRVTRTAAAEFATLRDSALAQEITEHSVVCLGNLGLWTAAGHRFPLVAWGQGATVVLHQGADQHTPFNAYDLTHVYTTPDLLNGLLRVPEADLRVNHGVRLLVTGGAMTKNQVAIVRKRVSRNIVALFGATETLTVSLTPIHRPEDLEWHHVLPTREVQIVDEHDVVLARGEQGFLRIKIDDGVTGYVGDPATSARFFKDGYFYPGDLAVLDADGRLGLRGRFTDVINVLGNKLATAPLERAMEEHLGVIAACIVSLQEPGQPELIHVILETATPVTREAWDLLVAQQLRPFQIVPVAVHQWASLPRNDMGKIQRDRVRQQIISRRMT